MFIRNRVLHTLVFSSVFLFSTRQLYTQRKSDPIPSCLKERALQLNASFSGGKGVGYNHGYATVEGFITPARRLHRWTPYLDLKGHLLTNHTFATNAGIGMRYRAPSFTIGINSYYDYRKTHHFHYNQIGLGLEAIGSFWNITLNGYIPVGKQRSRFFDFNLKHVKEPARFAYFEGHHLFISLPTSDALSARQEFSFKGIDARATFRLYEKDYLSLDLGTGPYYFRGAYKQFAAGGQASLTANLTDYLSFTFGNSYDNLFSYRAQGTIKLSVPLGATVKNKRSLCGKSSFYLSRVAQGAARNEIIVLDERRKVLSVTQGGAPEVAIDPRTGLPYEIWFINNQSHSDGTFENPFTTIQDALAVAAPYNIIYVYQGDGSPYDVGVPLLDDQLFLSFGVSQVIQTTKGAVKVPPMSPGLPIVQNSGADTIITLANRNTVSGFTLNVLNTPNTVRGTGIEGLSFTNNTYQTTLTAGMNNLFLTDCSGLLTIQNNQFMMDPADTGSNGIVIQDGASKTSTLSIQGNTFSNHASRAISLNYFGSGSLTLDISNQNSFTPPQGLGGTAGVDLFTNGTVTLSGSISNQNTFTGYTGNAINLGWNSTAPHQLTIAGNTISSDPTAPGSTGINLNATTSQPCSITISNNVITDQFSSGINLYAALSTSLNMNVKGNTVTGASVPGANGILFNANNTAILTGVINNNICSNHLGANITGFPNDSTQVLLTMAGNTLTGPTVVPGGSFPNGIQINGSGSMNYNLNIHDNYIAGHDNQGINLFVQDTATITATVNQNTVIAPNNSSNNSGIQVGASNSSAVTSTYIITNNTCSGHTNANIQSFPNNFSQINLTIRGNTLSGPTSPPPGFFTQGIQISTANSVICSLTIDGQNSLMHHSSQGMNIFSSDDSQMTALITNNTMVGLAGSSNTQGISLGCNTSAIPTHSYTITSNACSGHTGANIQCFPNNTSKLNLTITNNILSSITNGVAGVSPQGIQVGLNNSTSLLSLTMSGNKWTGPSTYQPMTGPQGFGLSLSDNATAANVVMTNNTAVLAMTSYPSNTGPTGIQLNLNNSSILTGLTLSNNSITIPFSDYADNVGIQGIQVNINDGSLTDATISSNTIFFAPLTNPLLTNVGMSGIQVGSGNTAIVGSNLSPVLIQNNIITNTETGAIGAFPGSSNDSYVTISNNTISLGPMGTGTSFGVITGAQGTGIFHVLIDGNAINGNNSAFFGIVALNQSSVTQDVVVQNNTITNVHSSQFVGGGIGTISQGTGHLNSCLINNALSGNTPSGIAALDSTIAGGLGGTICVKFLNNHGVGAQSPDGYTLIKDPGQPITSFTYEDAGGNTGTFIFVPSPGDFTAGSCLSCP